MTPDSFVDSLRTEVRDSAVNGCVRQYERPAGRRPPASLVELSQWFTGLSAEDRAMVAKVAHDVADATVFGLLCVLDGVRTIDDGPDQGELRLTYVKASDETRLNDPDGESLHDIWNTA